MKRRLLISLLIALLIGAFVAPWSMVFFQGKDPREQTVGDSTVIRWREPFLLEVRERGATESDPHSSTPYLLWWGGEVVVPGDLRSSTGEEARLFADGVWYRSADDTQEFRATARSEAQTP